MVLVITRLQVHGAANNPSDEWLVICGTPFGVINKNLFWTSGREENIKNFEQIDIWPSSLKHLKGFDQFTSAERVHELSRLQIMMINRDFIAKIWV